VAGSQGAAVEGSPAEQGSLAAEGSPAEQGSLAVEGSPAEQGSLAAEGSPAEQGSLAAEQGSLVEAGRQGQAVWGNRHRAGGAVSLGRTDSLEVARRGALRIEMKTKQHPCIQPCKAIIQ